MPSQTLPILFIANPAANRGASREIQQKISHLVQNAGAHWIETRYPRHALEMARQAYFEGMKAVVAIGGDGTVHEVVNGLMHSPAELRPSLGVIPSGTGNDFALGANISFDTMDAVKRILEIDLNSLKNDDARKVDIGIIRDQTGKEEFWDNSLGIGFDAAANLQARRIVNLRGFPMYLLAVLRTIAHNFVAARATLSADKRSSFEHNVMMLTVGNGKREGGGFVTTPNAKMDDGIFDFAMVHQLTRLQMLLLLPEVMRGTHVHSRHVRMGVFKTLHMRLDRPLPIHIDGEIFSNDSSTELEIEVLPQAIHLV
jgi:YegS/Rv2252/BmrU family lipid kinase